MSKWWRSPVGENASIQKHVEHFELEHGEACQRWYKKTQYRFRQDPVPGVYCYKASGKCYRYPRTYQAIRWNDAWEDLGLKGPRKFKHYPTSWDDIPCRWGERSWKRYRKTQYK